MNTIKFYLVVLVLFNSNCASENKSTKNMTKDLTEIIIYGKTNSSLKYKNGVFTALNKDEAIKINEIFKSYDLKINSIESKTINSENNSLPPMFSLLINKIHAKELCEKLNSITIIDGCYIKPKAEDPSLDVN